MATRQPISISEQPRKTPWDEWQETLEEIEVTKNILAELGSKAKKQMNAQLARMDGIPNARKGIVHLTQRESDVMEYLTSPPYLINKEIANKLNVSTRTVQFHVSSIIAKYGVKSRNELIMNILKPKDTQPV